MHIEVLLTKKHAISICSLLKTFFNFPSWVYFCVYPIFHWGILSKNVVKSGGWGRGLEKKYIKGVNGYIWVLYIEGGFKLSAHYDCKLNLNNEYSPP